MNVLVIPEDFVKDEHILLPIIRRLLADIGKPNAKVLVCRDPRLRGVGEALKWSVIQKIIGRYRYRTHVFILALDRDAEMGRRARLSTIELKAKEEIQCFLGVLAEEEVEVWVLAGHTLPPPWKWSAIRKARDPKEQYFEAFAKQRGVSQNLSGGRKVLAAEAVNRFARIKQLCPELVDLQLRIKECLGI
jgi:hypothetical protein